ncbi:MAG: YggT family protein [Treponema sp.]|nr:YggT family protein [Treponema sp.]
MRFIFGFLSAAVGIYSFLIFMRIIISWFSRSYYGKPVSLLTKITDPYLNWWRARLKLRVGPLDFSVIVAIVFLSLVQSIFHIVYLYGGISIRSIFSIILTSFWTIFSFIAGFCLIIIVLRLIAFYTNRNIYSPFWGIVNSIAQPILYMFRKLLYGNRYSQTTGFFVKVMIISIIIILGIMIGGSILVSYLSNLLRSPLI